VILLLWLEAIYSLLVEKITNPHRFIYKSSINSHDGQRRGNITKSCDAFSGMTSRDEGGSTWTQTFNAEGQLSQITDGSDTWTFIFDGDGNRIKQSNPDGTTTLFLGGGAYEAHIDGQTTTVTKYYAIGGQRVMRDSNDDLVSDERYLPFGGSRDSTGISQTDFAFTGQRNLGFQIDFCGVVIRDSVIYLRFR
jgi:YD repeat-containing protein